jgi:hypothetical protein
MDQRSICVFLTKKGLPALGIHHELVAVLGVEGRTYSTITRYLRQHHISAISSEPSGDPPITIIDDAILDALDKQPSA